VCDHIAKHLSGGEEHPAKFPPDTDLTDCEAGAQVAKGVGASREDAHDLRPVPPGTGKKRNNLSQREGLENLRLRRCRRRGGQEEKTEAQGERQ
jgi:hypothetical protein